MGRILARFMVVFCCTFLLAAAAQAKALKEVYLKDGGIIECQKVWQANGKVIVLVNRDTLVELAREEVDLKKTFGKKPAKGAKEAKIRKTEVPATAAVPKATVPAAKAAPPAPPQAAPAAAPPAPTVKPAAPPVAAAKPVAQPTPSAKPPAPAVPQTAAKPAPAPPKEQPPAAKAPVQGVATSAKKAPQAAADSSPRTALPVAKPAPPPPPPKQSFLAANMVNIALGVLLLLLVAGYAVYKKRQKG